MKKNFKDIKNKRRLTLSTSVLGMLYIMEEAKFCANNGEINLDASLEECESLESYQKIIAKASLCGLDTRNKGNEALIWGGIDYVDNVQYKNILLDDRELAKEHTITIKRERIKSPYDKLVYISKSLDEEGYNCTIDYKTSTLIYSEFNNYNR